MNPQDKLDHIKMLNTARQKKFYSLNADKVKEARRLKYKEQTEALKLHKGGR